MINTGQMLKRPGESPYSAYRRFLIANQRLNNTSKVLSEFQKIKIKSNETRAISSTDSYKPALLANLYETTNTLLNLSNIAHLQKGYRPLKHCPICAGLAFHTTLFDEPWIDKCPIHNMDLIESCQICKQYWPRNHELILRKCNGCGNTIDSTDNQSFNNQKTQIYKELDFLTSIIFKAKNIEPKFELFSENKQFSTKPIINNNQLFNISVMERLELLSDTEIHVIKKSTVPMFECYEKVFTVESTDYYSRKIHDVDDLEELKKEISIHKNNVFKKLKCILKPVIRSAINHKNQFKRYQAELTLTIIDLLINQDSKYVKDNGKIGIELYSNFISHGLTPPQVHHYFIEHDIYRDKTDKILYQMCREQTLLIYEIDLWTTINNVFNCLEKLEHKGHENFKDTSKKLLPHDFSKRCPYVFILNESKLSMFYPALIVKLNISTSNRLQKLMKAGGETLISFF